MRIKRKPVLFLNVLSLEAQCLPEDWHLYASELRNNIIKNNLYPTGPVMFQVKILEERHSYIFYVPISEEVDVKGLQEYTFYSQLVYEDGLLFRHSDSEESLEASYELLRMAASELGLTLKEPFFNIYIPVYGEAVIDIYAPICLEGEII